MIPINVLQKQIGELKEKSRDNEYIIESKLLEKDKKIEMFEKRQQRLIQSLIDYQGIIKMLNIVSPTIFT